MKQYTTEDGHPHSSSSLKSYYLCYEEMYQQNIRNAQYVIPYFADSLCLLFFVTNNC